MWGLILHGRGLTARVYAFMRFCGGLISVLMLMLMLTNGLISACIWAVMRLRLRLWLAT